MGDDLDEGVPPIGVAVDKLLRNEAGFGRYDVSRYVNQALQGEGVRLIAEHREGPGPDHDADRAEFGLAVRRVQRSGKVLLEPMTCKAVVDLDHDGHISRTLDIDVVEVFGQNPDYDPAAVARLAAAPPPPPSRVDFSRGTPEGSPGPRTRTRTPQVTTPRERALVAEQQASREPRPIRQALLEEVARLRRERTADEPRQIDDDNHQLG